MDSELIQGLGNKLITKEELLQKVEENSQLLPQVLLGLSSSKARIRYGCAKVLLDFSKQHPAELYPYMHCFIDLLDSQYRILLWNAIAIIADLTKVDNLLKFDRIFDKYYSYINDDYMVTVANVVQNSAVIARSKSYLVQRITVELLKIEAIKTTPHLTQECKRVIAEKTIRFFDEFFEQIEAQGKVIVFVQQYLNSSRPKLKIAAKEFIDKWNYQRQ